MARGEQICRLVISLPEISRTRASAAEIVGHLIRPEVVRERDVAVLLAVGYRTIRNWKYGSNLPKLEHYLRLAEVFSKDLDEVVLRKGETLAALRPVTRLVYRKRLSDEGAVEKRWRAALRKLSVISIRAVAIEAKTSITYVRTHLPHLLLEAREARAIQERERIGKRSERDRSRVRLIFWELIAENIYPSYRRIGERFGRRITKGWATEVIRAQWEKVECMPRSPFRRLAFTYPWQRVGKRNSRSHPQ
ncbi:hypothetical protein [Burkholderia sp. PU8-34]